MTSLHAIPLTVYLRFFRGEPVLTREMYMDELIFDKQNVEVKSGTGYPTNVDGLETHAQRTHKDWVGISDGKTHVV